MQLWFESRFFQIAIGTILVLLIILLAMYLLPLANFIFDIVKVILYPTIIALVLYYLLRPFRDFLEKRRFPRYISIAIIFSVLIYVITISLVFMWPHVSQQIEEFRKSPKEKIERIQNKTIDILNFFNISISKEKLLENLRYYGEELLRLLTENIFATFASVAQIASYLIITPFIFFYLLKDDGMFMPKIEAIIPQKYRSKAKKIASDIDATLSYYITGQIIVAAIVACLIFIGYWAIGLNYVLPLALIVFVFNLIPFMGPFISTIPAVLIGLSESPWMAFKVILIVIAVHLLDLNLISPRVVGGRMNIHPITIIFLLVACISSAGILGLFLVIPLYAVVKVLVLDYFGMKRKPKAVQNANSDAS